MEASRVSRSGLISPGKIYSLVLLDRYGDTRGQHGNPRWLSIVSHSAQGTFWEVAFIMQQLYYNRWLIVK
jgi:hypothetical protein